MLIWSAYRSNSSRACTRSPASPFGAGARRHSHNKSPVRRVPHQASVRARPSSLVSVNSAATYMKAVESDSPRAAARKSSANTRMVISAARSRGSKPSCVNVVCRVWSASALAIPTPHSSRMLPGTPLHGPMSGHDRHQRRNQDDAQPQGAPGTRLERAEAAIEPRERAGGERQHRDLPELDPEVEAEQREGDGSDEQTAQVVREPGSVHQPEHAREHRTIATAPPRAGAVPDQQVLHARGDDRQGDEELDQGGRQHHGARDRERERRRMADGERTDHPETPAPVSPAVDRREREQEQNVVHRGEIGDVAEPEREERLKVAHRPIAAAWRSSRGSSVPS